MGWNIIMEYNENDVPHQKTKYRYQILYLMHTRGCWVLEQLFERARVFPVSREQGWLTSTFSQANIIFLVFPWKRRPHTGRTPENLLTLIDILILLFYPSGKLFRKKGRKNLHERLFFFFLLQAGNLLNFIHSLCNIIMILKLDR